MQSDNGSFAMASFGIAEDPDAAARSKRVKIFAVSMAVIIALAGLWLSRSSHEAPVAKQPEKVEKPAPVAAAPAPPAPASAAPVAEKPKEEPKPEEKPTKAEAKRRRRAKKSAE